MRIVLRVLVDGMFRGQMQRRVQLPLTYTAGGIVRRSGWVEARIGSLFMRTIQGGLAARIVDFHGLWVLVLRLSFLAIDLCGCLGVCGIGIGVRWGMEGFALGDTWVQCIGMTLGCV